MTKGQVRIYTSEGEFIDREMTDAEYQDYLQIAARDKAKFDIEAEAAAKKVAAEAKLAALGLTAEDLKALGLG